MLAMALALRPHCALAFHCFTTISVHFSYFCFVLRFRKKFHTLFWRLCTYIRNTPYQLSQSEIFCTCCQQNRDLSIANRIAIYRLPTESRFIDCQQNRDLSTANRIAIYRLPTEPWFIDCQQNGDLSIANRMAIYRLPTESRFIDVSPCSLMRSLMISSTHPVCFGWQNREEWDRWGM